MSTRVAISGIRDVSRRDLPVIEDRIAEILSERPDQMLFGGARGTDTVALAAAYAALAGVRPPRLIVIVPKRLRDQPIEAQKCARECADEIIELQASRLSTEAYRRRNKELVSRADVLVAFWDGNSGGTGMTIALAEEAGVPVKIVPLLGQSAAFGAARNI
jgi:predicted Rossmann fold nucleotide-binding protein DprA/Smf involved in DNA uptake